MASPAPDRAKAERIDRLLRKQIGHSGLHMILPALIACDVDGTLLGEDEKVTVRTRDAVHAAIDAGVLFVLATGTISTLGAEHDQPVITTWNVPGLD